MRLNFHLPQAFENCKSNFILSETKDLIEGFARDLGLYLGSLFRYILPKVLLLGQPLSGPFLYCRSASASKIFYIFAAHVQK
jgi:hypothetical protein